MKKLFDQKGEWHWFTGGVVVSTIAIASYVLFQKMEFKNYAYGMTAGFGYIATFFKAIFRSLESNPLIKKYSGSPAAFIEFFMLIGIAIGGYTAAKLNNNYAPESIPAVWKKYHGDKLWKRYLVVLIGGFLLGWGAVFASGCTTGNILNGWAHLSVGSIVAGVAFFISGGITAKILYRKIGGEKMILKMIIGLLAGFAVGYAFQRTGITKYPRVTGMLLLKDFKILKFMLTAVTLSMIGFYILNDLGVISLNPKPLNWGKVIGGLIFGTGMGLLGYCPGTLASRIGEGKRDAWIGMVGMVLGILFFAVNMGFFKSHFMAKSLTGDIATVLGINHWFVIPVAAAIFITIIWFANKGDDFRDNF